MPAGAYLYNAVNHSLSRRVTDRNGNQNFTNVEAGRDAAANPPACAIVITSVFERSVRKYGPRGYRLATIEAGHILQNLSLVAGTLGLSSLVSASFFEAELEAMIGVDGVSEVALACFLCGAKQASPT